MKIKACNVVSKLANVPGLCAQSALLFPNCTRHLDTNTTILPDMCPQYSDPQPPPQFSTGAGYDTMPKGVCVCVCVCEAASCFKG